MTLILVIVVVFLIIGIALLGNYSFNQKKENEELKIKLVATKEAAEGAVRTTASLIGVNADEVMALLEQGVVPTIESLKGGVGNDE